MAKKRFPFSVFRLPFTFSSGFTLAELMITVALIAVLLVGVAWGWRKQTDRGYDAKRKADLHNIQNAFDDYYNDKNCYPPVSILSNCGRADLAPYLAEIPCDPHTKRPYVYRPLSVDAGNDCSGYRVLTTLKDKEDLDIKRVGCNADWCGFDDVPVGYNYGVSMGVQVPKDGFVSTSEPPAPAPIVNVDKPWACTVHATNSDCNNFGDNNICPIAFSEADHNSGACEAYCNTAPPSMQCATPFP